MRTFLILTAFCLVAVAPCLQQGVGDTARATPRQAMDIGLPDGAQVSFEVDARDDDLLGLVRKLIAQFDASSITSIPGIPGNKVTFNPADLSTLLRNIHRIHVVSYATPKDADAVAFFEPIWTSGGLHRMIYSGGDDPVLIMRGEGNRGMALLFQTGDQTVVIRTDGMLNMPVLGRIIGGVLKDMVMTQMPSTPKPSPKHMTKRHRVRRGAKPKPATPAVKH